MGNLERLEKEIISKLPRLEFLTYYDVKLNDVLEWLGIVHFGTYGMSCTGMLIQYSRHGMIHLGIKWDLSRSLLKDQSKELIEYLAGLI